MGNLIITVALWFGATMLTAWLDRRQMTDRSLALATGASYAVAALVSAFVYRHELRRLIEGGYDKLSYTFIAIILFGAIVGGIGAGWLYLTFNATAEIESHIRPRIAALGVGPLTGINGATSHASLEVTITNSGTPQSLDHYELTATLAGGRSVKGTPVSIPENGLEIDYPNRAVVVILRDESLDARTLSPIPTNGTVRGRLLFGFSEDPDQLQSPNTAFVLSMRDISGVQYSTPPFSIRPGRIGPDSDLPGLRPHKLREESTAPSQQPKHKDPDASKTTAQKGDANVGNNKQTMINSPGGIQAGGDVNVSSDRRLIQTMSLNVILEASSAAKAPGAPGTDVGLQSVVALFTADKTRIRFVTDFKVVQQQIAETRNRLSFAYSPETPSEILGREISFLPAIEKLAINFSDILKYYATSFDINSDQVTLEFQVAINGVTLARITGPVPPGQLGKGQLSFNVAAEFAAMPVAYAKVVGR